MASNWKLKNVVRSFGAACVAAVMAVGNGTAAYADDGAFPTQPITVVIPFNPGGRTDVVARLIAKTIEDNGWLDQPMVVVNASGGAGANAVAAIKKGEAEGHTIAHWHHQMLIAAAMQLGNFGPQDFTSIGYTGGGSPVWMVKEDSPYQSLDDIITKLKAEPRSLVEAVGIGTIPHFVGAVLAQEAGFETRYVNGASGADRFRLLRGGNADIALNAASEFLRQQEGLRAVTYFGRTRLPELPDVPTIAEAGFPAATWANPNWWLAPASMPAEHVEVIANALEKAVAHPDVVAHFKNNALETYWMDGDTSMADALSVYDGLKKVAETIK